MVVAYGQICVIQCSYHKTDSPMPNSSTPYARTAAAGAPGFQCIVIDPPWESKSVERGRNHTGHYPVLPSRNLLTIPLPRLMHDVRGWRGSRGETCACGVVSSYCISVELELE